MGGQGAYDWGGQGAPAMFKNSTGVNVNTVAAAGTVQADGGAITFGSGIWDVTAADGTKGVTLPVPTGWNGGTITIYNHSASNLKVYPHVGGDINDGSANAAVTVAANVWAQFASVDGTTWSAYYTAGGTYATLTGAETLTNKVLTSPDINGADITVTAQTKAAAGSVQGDATAITIASGGIVLCTGADATKGVKLPAAAAGYVVFVKNDDAANAVLKVWPNTSDAINAIAADSALSMAAKTAAVFVAYDAVTWYTFSLVPS